MNYSGISSTTAPFNGQDISSNNKIKQWAPFFRLGRVLAGVLSSLIGSMAYFLQLKRCAGTRTQAATTEEAALVFPRVGLVSKGRTLTVAGENIMT